MEVRVLNEATHCYSTRPELIKSKLQTNIEPRDILKKEM